MLPFSGVLLAVASAAGGAAIATGLTGGNLSQVLRASVIAGATAFAFFEVGEATNAFAGANPDTVTGAHGTPTFGTDAYAFNVAGHALVGCGAAVASGASCESGALSAGIGAAAGPALTGLNFGARLVATSVLGGVASVAGGGKFANGALTAAFGYLFNGAAGRLVGGYAGAALAGALGIETGPGAIAAGIAGRLIGGELGSALEDWLTGTGNFSPINPGPLSDDVANTFRSSTYQGSVLTADTTLYRAIGDGGNPAGSYWTRTSPSGPLESVISSGLDQNWGNTATTVVTGTFPAGTQIYEGVAAAQRGLVGGGNQIYIPNVNPNWVR